MGMQLKHQMKFQILSMCLLDESIDTSTLYTCQRHKGLSTVKGKIPYDMGESDPFVNLVFIANRKT